MITTELIPAEVLSLIPGVWKNQTTKDTWHFKPAKNTGYNPMEIIQIGSGIRFTYGYKTFIEEKMLFIDIDYEYFQVIAINSVSPLSITLKNNVGKLILLHKVS